MTPIPASQCALHSSTLAAQWWAEPSLFSPFVARLLQLNGFLPFSLLPPVASKRARCTCKTKTASPGEEASRVEQADRQEAQGQANGMAHGAARPARTLILLRLDLCGAHS